MPRPLRLGMLGGLLALVAALPFLLGLYHTDVVIFLLINVIVAVSYRFITLTGEWSLGHVVLMGMGGYGSALAAKTLGIPFWVSAPLAAAFTAFVAFLLAFPLFRMKGFYFLIGSFAAGEAIRLTWIQFRVPFGGPGGIMYIPSPEISVGSFHLDFAHPLAFYYLTLAVALITIVVFYRLENSRLGLTLHAIHWRDTLTESVGVNNWRYRAFAMVAASFFAAIAGALLGHYLGTVNPPQFSLAMMLYVVVWVIVGGTRTIAGPIVGVTLLTILDEALRGLEQERPLIYGAILILTIRFLPEGLESLPARLLSWLPRRTAVAQGPADGSGRPG